MLTIIYFNCHKAFFFLLYKSYDVNELFYRSLTESQMFSLKIKLIILKIDLINPVSPININIYDIF